MPCPCTTYSCLLIRYNPCSAGAELNIAATETGVWTAQVEFNGVWFDQSFEVTDGEKIIVNNIFNPNYVHEIRIYDISGDLVGCYKGETVLTLNKTYVPISPDSVKQVYRHDFTVTNETAQAFNQLIDAEVLEIEIQSIDIADVAVLDSNTGIITWNYAVGNGQTGFILYKK